MRKIAVVWLVILVLVGGIMTVSALNASSTSKSISTEPKFSTEPGPIIGDMLIPDDINRSNRYCLSLPGYYDTSEYMIGDVMVGIIFMESNGAIDSSTEDWTSTEKSNVISEIQAGLNWWAAREPNAHLTFTYDINYGVPTSYEPITRKSYTGSSSENMWLWINEATDYLGYPNDSYTGVRDYINAIRTANNKDWAFAIFVVDSSSGTDGDNNGNGYTGDFADGYFAYAYRGGPFLVMTYNNDGWGIGNMDAVTAHEVGHIFYALDEYAGASSATACSGYYNTINGNHVTGGTTNVPCIMRGDIPPYTNGNVCTYTREMIGWRDIDGDSILDVVDNFPDTSLNTYSPDPTNDNTPTYTGSASEVPYPNNNPYGMGNDVSINTITNVQYRVDYGTWQSVTATDGAFDSSSEAFTFTTTPLFDGTYTIQTCAQNSVGSWETSYSEDTITIDTTPPSNPTSFSSNPTVNTWSNNTVYVSWLGASDSGSGVYGYSYEWSNSATTVPDITVDTTDTNTTSPTLSDGSNWYFHVRTRDRVGNWASEAYHIGPFKIDTEKPSATIATPIEGKYFNSIPIWLNGICSDTLSGIKMVEINITWKDNGTTYLDWNNTNLAGNYSWWDYPFSPPNEANFTIYIRAEDNASNYQVPVTINLTYDTTPPSNPTPPAKEVNGAQNNTWQNFVKSPIFEWSWPSDNLVGVDGFYWYFGTSEAGVSINYTTTNTTSPGNAENGTYYFRIMTKDKAENNASWITLFIFKHDGEKPQIASVQAIPGSQVQGGYVNITCIVTDNFIVYTPKVNITGPAGFTPVNITMTGLADTNICYYNITYSIAGKYYYYIWTNDTSSNENCSAEYHFTITIASTTMIGWPYIIIFAITIILIGAGIGVKRMRKQKPVTVRCPKCKRTFQVPSAERPLSIVCPACGAGGTIGKLRKEQKNLPEKQVAEIPTITLRCPKCRETFKVEVKQKPFNVKCPYCGKEGVLK